jgi:8-oxo-dGTP pyrophosphatase MutT (NUDIX family)
LGEAENMSDWKPHVTVAAIVEREGRFLLVEEHTAEGIRLNEPAGHLEEGESLVEACVRETLEETAHQVVVNALVGIYQWARPQGDITYLRFVFACTDLGEDSARSLDEGIIRALWMSPPELARNAARMRSPLVMQCIQDYQAGQRFPLDLIRHMY